MLTGEFTFDAVDDTIVEADELGQYYFTGFAAVTGDLLPGAVITGDVTIIDNDVVTIDLVTVAVVTGEDATGIVIEYTLDQT